MTELLRARALVFGHDRRALTTPIDLMLHSGEIVVVLGPNGSGKSTLFRTLLGTLPPLSGTVHWGARALGELRPRELATQVAWVPQQPGAAFEFTVEQYVMLGRLGRLAPGAAPGRADREAVRHAIARLGIERFRTRALSRMSGGERQLAAIARALAQQASTLLLDEPTASLDPHAKHEVEALLQEFIRPPDDGAPALTMVFASHNLGQVKRLARRVVYLERGRVLADLPVELFFNRDVLRAVSPEADLFLKGELL